MAVVGERGERVVLHSMQASLHAPRGCAAHMLCGSWT